MNFIQLSLRTSLFLENRVYTCTVHVYVHVHVHVYVDVHVHVYVDVHVHVYVDVHVYVHVHVHNVSVHVPFSTCLMRSLVMMCEFSLAPPLKLDLSLVWSSSTPYERLWHGTGERMTTQS